MIRGHPLKTVFADGGIILFFLMALKFCYDLKMQL
jgi:hypothetical protein